MLTLNQCAVACPASIPEGGRIVIAYSDKTARIWDAASAKEIADQRRAVTPLGQEIVFLISLGVIASMLYRVAEDVDEVHRKRIFYAALVIFLFRATPGVGEGYRWFTIDVLGFDEAFYGTLAQIGAGLSLAGAWLFSDVITRKPIAKVLLWVTIIGTILSLPNIALALRLDVWTKETLGFGAHLPAQRDRIDGRQLTRQIKLGAHSQYQVAAAEQLQRSAQLARARVTECLCRARLHDPPARARRGG